MPPVASRYDMYSKTHASTADYDRDNPDVRRRIIAEDAQGRRIDVTSCAGSIRADAPPSPASLQPCLPGDTTPVRYLLLENRCQFDWNTGGRSCTGDILTGTFR